MSEIKDTYNTVTQQSESLFKDKGSKHFGYVFPVTSEEEVKEHLQFLRKEHYASRHVCYAFALGPNQERTRSSDDGEPSNSAGAPILGQIRSFELTNVLVAVVRYFGGTKLGVPGLINAYKTAAKEAIEDNVIVEKTIDENYIIHFTYPLMNDVMRITKMIDAQVIKQEFEVSCKLFLSIRKGEAQRLEKEFEKIHNLRVEKLEPK